jgi:general secretion pathway protein K
MTRQRGFALLIVLWTMGLLALLVAQFTATGRGEVQMAANLRANAVTEAAADGAVHEAILRLLQDKWSPDGRLRAIRVGTADVEVRIKDEEWKVNPNDAKLPVLQALFGHLCVEPHWRMPLSTGTRPALHQDPPDQDRRGIVAPEPPLPPGTVSSTALTRSGLWSG